MQKCSKRENLIRTSCDIYSIINEFENSEQKANHCCCCYGWLKGLIVYSIWKWILEKFHIIFLLSLTSIMEFHVSWFYSLRIVYYVGIVTANEMIVKIRERKKGIKFIVYRLVWEKWTCCVGRETCCLAKLRINVFHLWQMP